VGIDMIIDMIIGMGMGMGLCSAHGAHHHLPLPHRSICEAICSRRPVTPGAMSKY
jgi:hypothetical protein